MTKTIRGRTIELDGAPGPSEGLEVEIQIKVISKPGKKTGEGFPRTKGVLAAEPEWDTMVERIHTERKAAKWRAPSE